MQYKLKHRLSAALMAGAMCCTMIPAASADEIATPETADTAVPEVTDSAAPDISQITENLYNDLPDAPTGSYLGSMGLPVATGETKISISAWVSDLYDGADAYFEKIRKIAAGGCAMIIIGDVPVGKSQFEKSLFDKKGSHIIRNWLRLSIAITVASAHSCISLTLTCWLC